MKTSRSAARARPRTRDPQQKRALLIATARELFASRGFATTTTADVARRAGVSEGIVFHHFGSKAGLLEAAAADYGQGLAEAMFTEAPAGAKPSAEAMLRAAFAYVREHGELSRLLWISADAGTRRASREAIVAPLARAFAEWSREGRVRPLEPEIAAELVFALVEAALVACFAEGGGRHERAYLRETVACVEGALRGVSR
ncbi:MAG TPA: TetR/AcrR family transcriptional regulator [Myxococcota bacterium]|nr:TetR/AcrR family transcriptional regulator [Myxococcota bacterium]